MHFKHSAVMRPSRLAGTAYVYGNPFRLNEACLIAFSGKVMHSRSDFFFAYMSVTTLASDFKFVGAPVQRLWLKMVAL